MKFTNLALAGLLLPMANAQCISTNRVFDLEFKDECTYANLFEKFQEFYNDPVENCQGNAEDEFNSLLGDKTVRDLCMEAFESYDFMKFADIAEKGGDFEQLFYNGGTDWNEEYQTTYPTDEEGNPTNRLRSNGDQVGDAARVKHVYDGKGQHGMIEHPDYLTNFDQCSTNAIMCCWPKDRQANDNNGNCLTPYDKNCIDKDPADNTDLCYVDMERGQLSTGFNSSGIQVFPNDDGNTNKKPSTDFGEGQVHCHGLAWAEDSIDKSAAYKGNNLFFISMYDHMHERGYVKNIPGAPMCACTDQMPIVTRSDCTQIDVEETFKFSFNGVFSAELKDIYIDFNACQGINRAGKAKNNDLWAYMNRLFLDDKVGAKKLADLSNVLVGDFDGSCNRVVNKMMHQDYDLSTGYVHDDSVWTIVAGREGMDYTGNNDWHTYGPVAVEDLWKASENTILRRVCADCVPQLQDIFYKRLTPIPEGIPNYHLFKRIKNYKGTDENNVWNVDFKLYSTYEDALNDENAWDCDKADGYKYGEGFPGECSAYGRIRNQDTQFDLRQGKRNVGFYVEKSDSFALNELPSTNIGNPPFEGATYKHPTANRIYMTGSGTTMWNRHDQINFLWEEYTGDVELIVNVASLESSNIHTKSGIMVRGSLEQDSAYYGVMKIGDGGVRVQKRNSDSHNTGDYGEDENDLSSSWLRLLKKGNMYYGYKSDNGENWTLIHEQKLDTIVGEKFYVGLFHYGKLDRLTEAVFENYSHDTYIWPSLSPSASPAPTVEFLTSAKGYVACGRTAQCQKIDGANELIVDFTEKHEVRCCSDSTKPGWVKHSNCDVWAESDLLGLDDSAELKCHHAENYLGAVAICADNNARLCTKEEILNDCTKESGCGHDADLVWTSTMTRESLVERQWISCGAKERCGDTGGKLVDKSDVNETHAVRCCSDTQIPNWKKNGGCDVFTESDAWGSCHEAATFDEAVGICAGEGGRLCTVDEARRDCARGTGCMFDAEFIWTSSVGWIE